MSQFVVITLTEKGSAAPKLDDIFVKEYILYLLQ